MLKYSCGGCYIDVQIFKTAISFFCQMSYWFIDGYTKQHHSFGRCYIGIIDIQNNNSTQQKRFVSCYNKERGTLTIFKWKCPATAT